MPSPPKIDLLLQKQYENFGLTAKTSLTSVKSAEKFLKNVGISLRYWRTEKLPLASLYQAAVGGPDEPPKEKHHPGASSREEAQRIAIELTNHLLASHQGIEVNVIANRISLVYRDLVPSLYVLVRRHRPPDDIKSVSVQARKVFQFIQQNKETTAGLVRKFLGMPVTDLNNDPAYQTLAELQSKMLIDRGPFVMRKEGIPYLSKEGYPYHCFHLAHPELVKAAAKITLEEAATNFIDRFLRGAVFAPEKKIYSMFGEFLSENEMKNAIAMLTKLKRILTDDRKKDKLIVRVKMN